MISTIARVRHLQSRQILSELSLNSSPRTVRNRLQADPDLVWARKSRKPPLTDKHRAARLGFALEHHTWTLEWDRVVLSDEKKFNLDGPDGLACYWQDLRYQKEVFSKRQFGGGSVMVWAGFGAAAKTRIAFDQFRVNKVTYPDVLGECLLPDGPLIVGERWIFQQDNARCHTSGDTVSWFDANGVTFLPWPARSPDLNPVENLWG